MSLEILKERLAGSGYDPVIWEDILPLEEKVEKLENVISDLVGLLQNIHADDPETEEALKEILNQMP